MSELQPIEVGSYVYWTDPDHATCNAIGTVQAVSENPDGTVDEHSIYTVKILSGSIVEAPRNELSYISSGSTVRSVVASTPSNKDSGYDLCASLSREADVEITHHVNRIWPNTRYFKVKAKKGPRTTRTYRIPPTRWMVDMKRGKHRGHLPVNMGGTRLFGIGLFNGDPSGMNDDILKHTLGLTAEKFNSEFNGGLLITPELQAALRDRVSERRPGLVRKQITHKPDVTEMDTPVRNPLPIPLDRDDK